MTGRMPPENVKPFNAAVAAFVLMAPEDLEQEDIKEEFECDDAATCPACKKILDKHGGPGRAGGRVRRRRCRRRSKGFRGLKPGSTITVEGEVKRDGKDKKLVRISATKFYPG